MKRYLRTFFIILAIYLPMAAFYVGIHELYINTAYASDTRVIHEIPTETPPATPYNPVKKPVIVLTFTHNAADPTPTPTAAPSPTPEATIEYVYIWPTVTPSATIDPIASLNKPYLLDRNQVQTFMLWDMTDQHPYTSDYMCGSFAHTVIDNAWAFGIVGRYTVVWSPEWSLSHAIICFPTVNDGNVFVDATAGDWWAYPDNDNKTFYTVSMIDPTRHGFGITSMTGYVIYQEYGK